MAYEDPSCAYCPPKIRACRKGEEAERGPGWCPSKVSGEAVQRGLEHYDDPFVRKVAQESARVEAEGYCQWCRVEEVCEFAKRMGFKKIGIAHCIGLIDLANTFTQILESHGFEAVSVCCKAGGHAKENIGLTDAEKVRPGGFEGTCNPVSQAEVLNDAGTDLNVVMGLCVGHDSLFYRYSKALVTTLVAKDRALGHNPAAALLLADSYLRRVWGPDRPETPPKKPRQKKA